MKTYHILTLLVVFLFTGCLKEEKMSIETLIKVNMPEGFESMNPEGIDVKLYSTTSGLTYTSKCIAVLLCWLQMSVPLRQTSIRP